MSKPKPSILEGEKKSMEKEVITFEGITINHVTKKEPTKSCETRNYRRYQG